MSSNGPRPVVLKVLVQLTGGRVENLNVQIHDAATVDELVGKVCQLIKVSPHELDKHIIKCGNVVATNRSQTLKEAGLTLGRISIIPATQTTQSPLPVDTAVPAPAAAALPPAPPVPIPTAAATPAPNPTAAAQPVPKPTDSSRVHAHQQAPSTVRSIEPALRSIVESKAGAEDAPEIIDIFTEHCVFTLEDAKSFLSSKGRDYIAIALRSKIMGAVMLQINPEVNSKQTAAPMAAEPPVASHGKVPPTTKAPAAVDAVEKAKLDAQRLQQQMTNDVARRSLCQRFESEAHVITIGEESNRQRILTEFYKTMPKVATPQPAQQRIDYIYVEVNGKSHAWRTNPATTNQNDVINFVRGIDRNLTSVEVVTNTQSRVQGQLSTYGVQYGDTIRVKVGMPGGFA